MQWLALITAATAIAIGHILGGPEPAKRSDLAAASLARNIGLALFIGELANLGETMVLGALLALPYSIWMNYRQRASRNPADAGI